MFKKHAALLLGVLAVSAFHSLSMAWAGDPGGTYRISADAFWIESGWQREPTFLRAREPGQASSEIVLPSGQFTLWARFQGQLQLTAGSQSWNLRESEFGRWQRVAQVGGGRMPLSISGSGDTQFCELRFTTAAHAPVFE